MQRADEFSARLQAPGDARAKDGVPEVVRATLCEVSIVQEAAVPGSELIAVRSAAESAEEHGPIARRLAAVEARGPRRSQHTINRHDLEDAQVLDVLARLAIA